MKTRAEILSTRIEGLINFHAASVPSKVLNTGSPEAFAKSLGLPDAEHVAVLLQSRRLQPVELHRNAPKGALFFSAQDVESVKREAFAAIAEQVVEGYRGAPEGLAGAVHVALGSYAKNLKAGTAAKGFSRVAPRALSFARPQEERPGLLRRVATGAAIAGAAYAGGSYLRGRKIGATGFLPSLKAGHAANVADIRKAGKWAAGFIRPRKQGKGEPVNVTPSEDRSLVRQFGRQPRRSADVSGVIKKVPGLIVGARRLAEPIRPRSPSGLSTITSPRVRSLLAQIGRELGRA
jgi:hypothetical protein